MDSAGVTIICGARAALWAKLDAQPVRPAASTQETNNAVGLILDFIRCTDSMSYLIILVEQSSSPIYGIYFLLNRA